jgi:DNA-binding NarL/FixJ family response regulator
MGPAGVPYAADHLLPPSLTLADVVSLAQSLSDSGLTPERTAAQSPRWTGLLSDRETQVLGLLACGQSNAEIASELVLSVRTVEKHVANVYAKIAARGRADTATYALRHGFLNTT